MSRHPMLCVLRTIALSLASSYLLFAADGRWIGGSGNWSNPNNWQNGIIADGPSNLAIFAPSVEIHVTVDTARTIGHIRNDGSANVHIWGPATLTLLASPKPTITNTSFGATFLRVPLAGPNAFAKHGGSRVVMWKNITHTMTGNIRVDGGELRLDSAGTTIPAVNQVYVAGSDSAARLHVAEIGDPISVYPCTFRISGLNGLNSGEQGGLGPLFIYGDRVEAAVSNILLDTYIGQITRIGQYGAGGKIEFRGTISGTNSYLELFVNGVKTNDMIGSNTYALTTYVRLANSSSHTVLNIRGPQRLPKNMFYPILAPHAHPGGTCVIDLHGYRQETTYNHVEGGTLRFVSSTPGGSWWADYYPNYALVLNGTNTLIVDGATVGVNGHIVNRQSSHIIVTNNGYLFCSLELLQGFSDGPSVVTIATGGYARIFVLRAANSYAGTLNVEPGGRLAMAGAWTGNQPTLGTINLNGGILSDWNDAEWEGSSTNWIRQSVQLMVRAGGARIQIDYPSGRVLEKTLQNGGGGGGLTKLGSGVLTLTATNSYTGNTIVQSGTLRITTQGAIPSTSPIIEVSAGATCDVSSVSTFNIVSGQRLRGNGLILGNLNLQPGAALDPGTSIGWLSLNGNLTMQAGARYTWEFNSSTSDWAYVTQALSFPGPANSVTVAVRRLDAVVYPLTRTLFIFGTFNPATTNRLFFDLTDSSMQGIQPPTISVSANAVLITLIPEPAACTLLLIAMLFLRRSAKYVL